MSKLKIETSRANGAKSHGPVTPEGKARSAANSRRHGLAAASILIEGESQEDFDLLLADFLHQFQPQTAVETDLVEVMAIARWRLRRLLAMEAHMLDLEMLRRRKQMNSEFDGMEPTHRLAFVFQELSENGQSLTLLLRYEGSLNRTYDKALKQLLLLQSTRHSAPPQEPLGSFCNSRPTDAPKDEPPTPEVCHANVGQANVEQANVEHALPPASSEPRPPEAVFPPDWPTPCSQKSS
jgi:hypothetical protein